MDFDLSTFTTELRAKMFFRFPYLQGRGTNKNGTPKHGRFNEEIRHVAFDTNMTIDYGDNIKIFEIGNDYAETNYPYYHILEDAPVIHKAGHGTKQSKGSQQYVRVLKNRDYGIVSKKTTSKGKVYYKQEYRGKNYRGKRLFNLYEHSQHKVLDLDTNVTTLRNDTSPTYMNEHYHYIEEMLDKITDELASEYNMRKVTTRNSTLDWGNDTEDYDTDFLETLVDM